MNTFERELDEINKKTYKLEPITEMCGVIICHEVWDDNILDAVDMSISVRKFLTFVKMVNDGVKLEDANFGDEDFNKTRMSMHMELYIWHLLSHDPYLADKLNNTNALVGYMTAKCMIKTGFVFPVTFIRSVVNLYAPLLYKLSEFKDICKN